MTLTVGALLLAALWVIFWAELGNRPIAPQWLRKERAARRGKVLDILAAILLLFLAVDLIVVLAASALRYLMGQ